MASSNPARRPPSGGRRRLWATVSIGVAMGVVAIAMSVSRPAPVAPTDRNPEAVASGAELYAASCAMCHGPDLRGTMAGPPFLDVIYAPNHHSDEAFQRAVLGGVVAHHWDLGNMPPIPGLTPDDVALIVAFVRSEQEANGLLRDPSHP